MPLPAYHLVAVTFVSILTSASPISGGERLQLRLPTGHLVNQTDQHLCTAFRLPRNQTFFINEVTAVAKSPRVTHILIYGCESPSEEGGPGHVWRCDEANICRDAGRQLFFLGEGGTPSLRLPPGAAFAVGAASGTPFLVLDFHFPADVTGQESSSRTAGSGVDVMLIPERDVTRTAGIIDSEAHVGVLPAHGGVAIGHRCRIASPAVPLQPIAAKVHTHSHGLSVSGSRVNGQTGEETLIMTRSPQDPQVYYPLVPSAGLRLHDGDWVTVRCLMQNREDSAIMIGETADDEMCDFSLVYLFPDAVVRPGARCDEAP